MVTIGQRRGIGLPGGGPKRYVLDVDMHAGVVVVGDEDDLMRTSMRVEHVVWTDEPQARAGPRPVLCARRDGDRRRSRSRVTRARSRSTWDAPQRRVAPGQSVVFYDAADRLVLGGGIAAR